MLHVIDNFIPNVVHVKQNVDGKVSEIHWTLGVSFNLKSGWNILYIIIYCTNYRNQEEI